MLLWALTLSPTPGLLGLAAALAVLAVLIVAVASGMARPASTAVAKLPGSSREQSRIRPRLADPGAAGRPRPRAPSAYPTAV